MASAKHIIFRNLTDADFFNINKPPGSESRGGGQSYIDFPVKAIPISDWNRFFENILNVDKIEVSHGPCWEFPIHSIGLNDNSVTQDIKIYQRREKSVSITSQKLYSSRSNRVRSWHPDNGFPNPIDNTIRNQCPDGLMVYLVSTYEGEVWAGWYLNDGMTPPPILGDIANTPFADMISPLVATNGHSQIITFEPDQVTLDTKNIEFPFILNNYVSLISESKIDVDAESLETEEVQEAEKLFASDFLPSAGDEVKIREHVIKTKQRNTRIVRKLKALYNHRCQITGTDFIFAKKNGENYTEAHHLIPLGEDGSDTPQNLLILSPLVHKMLHHADVSEIDLAKMVYAEDGSALLEITINGKPYIISWHPKHAELFNG